MRYDVKNVKSWKTEDGGGFQASLYLDGKKLGQVTDHGWGGGIEFNLEDGAQEALTEFCKTLPEETSPFSNDSKSPDIDSFICSLLDRSETKKRMVQELKKNTDYIKEGHVWKSPTPYSDEYVEWLRGRNPGVEIVILNEMDIDEAVDLVIATEAGYD